MTPTEGNSVNKLCAAVALACAFAAPAAASEPSIQRAETVVQRAETVVQRAETVVQRAEAAARQAVAPLVVERALCIRQVRRRVVCFLAHPDAGTQECRSVVLVRARRARVLQTNVCFEFRKVTP
jgi:hypothetical protein